jgi:lauroyl/myristoyl acyltransferase
VDRERVRATLRMDGGFWRRFAELGCVYGPEWWKRASPPVIAGIIYALARGQRAAVLRNQRQILGPRAWWREQRDGWRVFAELARSMTETLEQWGPRPKPLDLTVVNRELFRGALAEGRGLVVVTGSFGSWEVAARVLDRMGPKVSMVGAQEANPTVRAMLHRMRTRHGFGMIYSDRSLLSGLPVVQALRRGEIVCMKIEPWGPMPGTQPVPFCGRTAWFQLGPFTIARVAKAPLVAVFAVRTGIRRYELRALARFDPRQREDSVAALEGTVRVYEALVRERPWQWLKFEDAWRDDEPAGGDVVPLPAPTDARRSERA